MSPSPRLPALGLALIHALAVIAITTAHSAAQTPTPTTPVATDPETDTAIKNFAVMTREELERHTTDVRRQIGDLTLVPPTINTKPLPEFDYPNLDYAMTLGIERTPGGRLWAAWVAGDDGPAAFVVAATSDDQGNTWSKTRFVINAQIPNFPVHRSVIVGNFWTDPLGRLWIRAARGSCAVACVPPCPTGTSTCSSS